jgi:hypothetical protein
MQQSCLGSRYSAAVLLLLLLLLLLTSLLLNHVLQPWSAETAGTASTTWKFIGGTCPTLAAAPATPPTTVAAAASAVADVSAALVRRCFGSLMIPKYTPAPMPDAATSTSAVSSRIKLVRLRLPTASLLLDPPDMLRLPAMLSLLLLQAAAGRKPQQKIGARPAAL